MSADTTDHLRETLLRRRDLYDNHMFTVHEDEVGYPSGRSGIRLVVDHPGAVGIVPVTDAGDVVLVRQWRHATGRAYWEIPAGTRDGDEDPRLCAERELAEETGYTARSWTDLGRAHMVPGYSSEELFLFLATGLEGGDAHPDEDELLDVEAFSRERLIELIAAGEVDMKTIAGLALAGYSVRG